MKKGKLISSALLLENFRRFWSISAVGFLFYFMSGPYIMLYRSGRSAYSAGYYGVTWPDTYFLGNLMDNQNFGFEAMHLVLPVVAAVCVFSYLNKTNSVGFVHALPLSKRTLFATNCLSGLGLSFVPYLINWVICMVCMAGMGGGVLKEYAVSAFVWLLSTLVIQCFVLSLAVLACMVSGNGVIALLTGFAFNFLPHALLLSALAYEENFLFGFVNDGIGDTVFYLSPWSCTIYDDGIGGWALLIYFAVAAAVAVLADVLYHRRKLERAGDSYVFGWMQTIIGFLFVYFFTSVTGLMFFEGFGIMAYVLGFIIGFLVGQMISLKTLHIFNKKSLKNLVIFAVIMALIVSAFAVDIFGFEKRVPKAERVEKVEYMGMSPQNVYSTMYFTSEDAIKNAVGLHQEIVDDLDAVKAELDDESWSNEYNNDHRYPFVSVTIKYYLKNGGVMARSYRLKTTRVSESPSYKALMNSTEAIQSLEALRTMEADELLFSIMTEYGDYGVGNGISLTDSQARQLLEAMALDIRDTIKSGRFVESKQVYNLDLTAMTSKYSEAEAEALDKYYDRVYNHRAGDRAYVKPEDNNGKGAWRVYFMNFEIFDSYTRTVTLLKSWGY